MLAGGRPVPPARPRKNFRKIPVIGVTAHAMADERKLILDFFSCYSGTKPICFTLKLRLTDRSELYSSGSTLTIDAPWLLPIQSVPGSFESST